MHPDPTENLFANIVSKDGLVESVEPSDLKNVWKMGEEIREQHGSNEHISIDVRMFATVCSPGANVKAVWYRVSMLGIAQQMGLLNLKLPSDAMDVVFNVAARFPMRGIEPGVVYDGLPLDVQAFVKQIEDELSRLGNS